ncbi:hypothetical protein FRC09_010524 [Ceratobasidium sp. 395]|nr:hypothetical protein FRC09_010524 [Ceratobasidium sp. 395]
MSDDLSLQSVLNELANSPKLESLIQKLGALRVPPVTRPTADVKSYGDAVYHNFYPLGISLMFAPPTKGAKVALEQFVCDSIDVMNVPDAEPGNTRAAKATSAYRAFPGLALLSFPASIVGIFHLVELDDAGYAHGDIAGRAVHANLYGDVDVQRKFAVSGKQPKEMDSSCIHSPPFPSLPSQSHDISNDSYLYSA